VQLYGNENSNQMIMKNLPLEQFADHANRAKRAGDADWFFQLAEPLAALAATNAATVALNQRLHALTETPALQGDWAPNQIRLARGDGWKLSLWMFEQTSQYIHSASAHSLYTPTGATALQYDLYRLPDSLDRSVFDRSARLALERSGQCVRGEVLGINADSIVVDFRIGTPVVVFRLDSEFQYPVEWLFHRDLSSWQANDASLSSTQLRVGAYVLGRLSNPTSADALVSLTKHAHHSVRWAAIQALSRISRTETIECLKRALSDPHPHIRRSAASTLARLSPESAKDLHGHRS
jgi:hypothetical protein